MKLYVPLFCSLLALPLTAVGAEDGKALYEKSCKACHGANGEGNAKLAAMMKVEMRALSSPEVQSKPDADLKKIITAGAGKMKPVKSLSGEQVSAVVAFVRTLKK